MSSGRGIATATATMHDGREFMVSETAAWPPYAMQYAIEALYGRGYEDIPDFPAGIARIEIVWTAQ